MAERFHARGRDDAEWLALGRHTELLRRLADHVAHIAAQPELSLEDLHLRDMKRSGTQGWGQG